MVSSEYGLNEINQNQRKRNALLFEMYRGQFQSQIKSSAVMLITGIMKEEPGICMVPSVIYAFRLNDMADLLKRGHSKERGEKDGEEITEVEITRNTVRTKLTSPVLGCDIKIFCGYPIEMQINNEPVEAMSEFHMVVVQCGSGLNETLEVSVTLGGEGNLLAINSTNGYTFPDGTQMQAGDEFRRWSA